MIACTVESFDVLMPYYPGIVGYCEDLLSTDEDDRIATALRTIQEFMECKCTNHFNVWPYKQEEWFIMLVTMTPNHYFHFMSLLDIWFRKSVILLQCVMATGTAIKYSNSD